MAPLQIISVAPENFNFRRTYSPGITIPACPNDKSYTSLWVEDATDYKIFYPEYDYTKAERTPITVTSQQIVNDLFNAEDLENKGCFAIPDAAPSKEQLEAARARRKRYLQNLVQQGDVIHSRTGKVDEIPDYMKRACLEISASREWAFAAPALLMECEACGTEAKQLKNGNFPILCQNCGYPLPGQKEKAMEEGLWQPKRAPGRPKQEKEAE